MRPRITILLLAGISLFGAACPLYSQAGGDEPIVDEATVVSAIEAAETSRQRAAEADAEWLQTASLIQEAREALENGDRQQAMLLAEQAAKQGQLAVEQAERESVAWREREVR